MTAGSAGWVAWAGRPASRDDGRGAPRSTRRIAKPDRRCMIDLAGDLKYSILCARAGLFDRGVDAKSVRPGAGFFGKIGRGWGQ
jgi:hypothetical protein